jgi:AcrR family transcriptional regulator
MPVEPESRPGRGRPADPEVEQRVHLATLEVYEQTGWVAFTIDAVASRSRVGKAAIYRRWASKEELIVDALDTLAPDTYHFATTDDFRADLVHFTERTIVAFGGPLGLVFLRAQLEAKVYPQVFGTAMESSRTSWIAAGRAGFDAAIRRGEVSRNASSSLIFDAIRGSILNHFLFLPPDRLQAFVNDRHEFALGLVDFVLDGSNADA